MAKSILPINNQAKTFIFNQKPVDNAWVFDVYVHGALRNKECQYAVALRPYKKEYLPVFVPEWDTNGVPAWVFEDENILKVSNEIKRLFEIPKK